MKYHDTVEEGLDFFDPEGRVFPKIAAKVANGQELSKQDILLILKWKLGRLKESNKGTIADNKMKVINSAIKDAGKDDSRIAALTALDGVPEIGLAVATAILTVCYPERFTIIDWRVLEVLDLFPSRLPKAKRKEHSTNHWTAEDYIAEFLPKVKERSELWHCELRNADRALWGLSVKQWVEELIQKS